MVSKKTSAGILLYRWRNKVLEVFIAHPGGPFQKKDLGEWSIPKGEVNEGEALMNCAIRELKEETGIGISTELKFIPLGAIQQKGGKIVHAWAVKFEEDFIFDNTKSTFTIEWPPHTGKIQTFPEIDRGGFYPAPVAREKLKLAQVAFIDRLEEYLPGSG
ncbi:MAG: NUDIX domain-containing protein [Ignavibacteria bacterium]